jgi:hypothetical protein
MTQSGPWPKKLTCANVAEVFAHTGRFPRAYLMQINDGFTENHL